MSAAVDTNEDTVSEILTNEPMSSHTSWRVGGPADFFCRPRSVAAIAAFLHDLPAEMPVFWTGLGSNLLVRDGGIRGAVICTVDLERQIERVDGDRVRVTASVPCTTLARHCVRLKLGPAAFFAGIPGTIGGALAMNAGAHGGETWDRVESVRTIDRSGKIHERAPGEYTVGYRSVTGPKNEWFIEATLRFEADVTPSAEDMKSMLERRKRTQPLGLPSCGSVFRNPPGDHAARLIEAAGLKGFSIGGAEVSRKHANFIINSDNATASDVEALIGHVRQAVFEKHGVELIHEVRIVGEVAK